MTGIKLYKKGPVDAGGQGTVFEAWIEDSGEKVALKELQIPPTGVIPEESRRRFLREVRCQATLSHPNIVRIIAQNSANTPPWYVMPWADSTLRSRLDDLQFGGLPEVEALAIFTQLLDAMEYAHSEGVLHRDLKPANVLFIDGSPRISDFGLSKKIESMSTALTMSNMGLGTWFYSAPEQMTNAYTADMRADIYSLGKMFYEMLTGRVPFPSMDFERIPVKYQFLIEKATQEKPERRYSTVSQLIQELKLLVEDEDPFQVPTERAKILVEKIASGNESAVADLNQLLLRNADDLHLYTQFVPFIPANVLITYARVEPSGLRSVVYAFDKYADGSHPFSYTDKISLFLERVFILLIDRDVRSMILTRVLILGKEHNRYFVREMFIELVKRSCDTNAGAALVAQVLTDNPSCKDFVDERLRASISLPPVISNVL